jgi:hypothetical protein
LNRLISTEGSLSIDFFYGIDASQFAAESSEDTVDPSAGSLRFSLSRYQADGLVRYRDAIAAIHLTGRL